MLELRPTCENCNKALPPDSTEARICSYECTFCGGGFAPRPVDPTAHAGFAAAIKSIAPHDR